MLLLLLLPRLLLLLQYKLLLLLLLLRCSNQWLLLLMRLRMYYHLHLLICLLTPSLLRLLLLMLWLLLPPLCGGIWLCTISLRRLLRRPSCRHCCVFLLHPIWDLLGPLWLVLWASIGLLRLRLRLGKLLGLWWSGQLRQRLALLRRRTVESQRTRLRTMQSRPRQWDWWRHAWSHHRKLLLLLRLLGTWCYPTWRWR